VWPALANDKAGHGGAPDVRVAVMDTGFYFDGHTDLGDYGNITAAIDECDAYWPSRSAASQLTTDTTVTPASPVDGNPAAPHGTMVASQIGQGTSNYIGSSGAAWDTRVDVYKIQGVAMSGPEAGHAVMPDSALVKAIYDAVDDAHTKGYRLVINMSLVERSGSAGSTAVRNAIAYAKRPEHDVIVVAAAGNDGNSVVSYPAAYDGVIAVGASTIDGDDLHRASFSNYGTKLDVLAPGEHIWGPGKPGAIPSLPGSTAPDPEGVPGYDWWDGTSMAAPYVSSAAALLLRVEPSLTATEVEAYLTGNTTEMGVLGRDNETGWGQLDVHEAYLALATPHTTVEKRPAYVQGATITFSVTDRDSGPNVTSHYRLDSGEECQGATATLGFAPDPGNVHTIEYWSEDSNGVAEEAGWFAFQVLEPDLLAPITTSDVTRTYAGRAAIHLSAHDPSPGWIGSKFPLATYYRLDSGTTAAGTGLIIGSTGLHTLRYWSVDYAGNVETATVATFTIAPLTTRVTLARSPSTIRHGAHIHLSGTLSPAREGDRVSIQVKMPGSHTWRYFTGSSKYYRRSVGMVDEYGRGAWSTLTYTLRTHGRYYFRVVYAGDSSTWSRKAAASSTVSVLVR
jgi:subtilisin family serine protease